VGVGHRVVHGGLESPSTRPGRGARSPRHRRRSRGVAPRGPWALASGP
jgi:hypothetical protein